MKSVVSSSPSKHVRDGAAALTRCLIPLQAPAGFEALQQYTEQTPDHQTLAKVDQTRLIEPLPHQPGYSSDDAKCGNPFVVPKASISEFGEVVDRAATTYEASPRVPKCMHDAAYSLADDPIQQKSSTSESTASNIRSPLDAPTLRTDPYSRPTAPDRSLTQSNLQKLRAFRINRLSKVKGVSSTKAVTSVEQQPLSPAPNSREAQQLMMKSRQPVVPGESKWQSPSFTSTDHKSGVQEVFNCVKNDQAALGERGSVRELNLHSGRQPNLPRKQPEWRAANNSEDTLQSLPSVSNNQQMLNVMSHTHPSCTHQPSMISGQDSSTPILRAKTSSSRVLTGVLANYIKALRRDEKIMALGNLFSRRFDPSEHNGTRSEDTDAGLMLALFGCVLSGDVHGGWLPYAFAMADGLSALNAVWTEHMQCSSLPLFFEASPPAQTLFNVAISSMPDLRRTIKQYFEMVGRMYLAWKENPFKAPVVSKESPPDLQIVMRELSTCFEELIIPPQMHDDWIPRFPVVSLMDYKRYVIKHMTGLRPQQREFRDAMTAIFALLREAPDKRDEAYLRFIELRYGQDIRSKLRRGLRLQAFEQLLNYGFLDAGHLLQIIHQRMPPEMRSATLLGLLLSANVFVIAMGLEDI
eukprot:Blabericola_migrator_1__8550@NODE_446_length_8402_cov_75_646551_g349_i0_p2_GENE_NODE_446_length_8402_cov_75_646551_g349_i0NODE_446_length_8402_cov_75_646551_g349_i0_p2_ORF_typecomplete_len637_score79_97_NODE_446_length_8402_cov_75_646551_g349_i027824692